MATQYGEWGSIKTNRANYRLYVTYSITEAADSYTVNLIELGAQVYSKTYKTIFLTGTWDFLVNGSVIWSSGSGSSIVVNTKKDGVTRSGYIAKDTGVSKKIAKTHSSQTAYITFRGVKIIPECLTDDGWVYGIERGPAVTASASIEAKNSYTISYNSNSGSGAPGGQTKWYGEDINLQAGKPTKTGYTFRCWNTKQNGTGTNYNPSQKYTANSGMTLYAQWTPISVTLSYNANGGTGAPGPQTKVYDTSLKLQTGTPTRTGYTFKGWATTQARANAGTVDYAAGAMYSTNSTSNIVLWAAWTPVTVTLTYDANGGINPPAAQSKLYNSNLTLTTDIPQKEGYSFVGWSTSKDRADSGTIDYSPGGTHTASSTLDITLWAAWTPNPYDVTYNANGGTGAPSAQIKYHDISLTLRNEIPVRDRWLFRGWATSEANAEARKNSGIAEYLPGDTYTGNTLLTLWAIWHAVYTYTFTTKRVEAEKSTKVATDGDWIMIELSISSPDASGNGITSILFKDRDISESATQSISWYIKEGNGEQQFNNPLVFPYIPESNNTVLYGWYQRDDEEARLERHTFSIQVDDAIKEGEEKIIVLPPVYKIIDVKPPGDGIAFGKTATKVGMEIAMPVYIEGNPLFVTDIKPLEDKIAFGKAATNPGVEFAMPVSLENKPLTISNATINQINTTIDLKEADNGITAAKYYAHVYRDKNNKEQGRFGFGTYPDGRTRTEMTVRNYDADGNQVANKGFAINMDKSGNVTYSVTQPEQLRKALSLEKVYEDIPLPSDSKFVQYQSGVDPVIKKVGPIVHIDGAVKPKAAITADDWYTFQLILTLPEEYRPEYDQTFICQGSGNAIWTCSVTKAGALGAQRYRKMTPDSGKDFSTTGTWEWFPFNLTWII